MERGNEAAFKDGAGPTTISRSRDSLCYAPFVRSQRPETSRAPWLTSLCSSLVVVMHGHGPHVPLRSLRSRNWPPTERNRPIWAPELGLRAGDSGCWGHANPSQARRSHAQSHNEVPKERVLATETAGMARVSNIRRGKLSKARSVASRMTLWSEATKRLFVSKDGAGPTTLSRSRNS